MSSVTLFTPASSPGRKSRVFTANSLRSAQRWYMRRSISAQSWASVPPRAGMDLEDGRRRVLRAAEERAHLGVLQPFLQGVHLVREGLEHVLALVLGGHGQPFVEVFLGLEEPVPQFDHGRQAAFFLQQGLEFVGLVPGTGLGENGLYFVQTFDRGVVVKDASRGCRIDPSGLRLGLEVGVLKHILNDSVGVEVVRMQRPTIAASGRFRKESMGAGGCVQLRRRAVAANRPHRAARARGSQPRSPARRWKGVSDSAPGAQSPPASRLGTGRRARGCARAGR